MKAQNNGLHDFIRLTTIKRALRVGVHLIEITMRAHRFLREGIYSLDLGPNCSVIIVFYANGGAILIEAQKQLMLLERVIG